MSFRLKIVLGLLGIQTLLIIFLVWSSLNFLRISNEVELSNRASSTASILASTLGFAVAVEDSEGLTARINDVLTQPDIVYIRVVGRNRVLAEVGESAMLARPFTEDFLFEDVTDGVYDVAAEIREGSTLLGRVELGISTEEIGHIMSAARREMTTIALIGLGVSLLFSILLGNYFARQLTRLKDATRRIASGDIGYQLTVAGNDELAQTANAFNTMSRKLAMLYSDKQSALNRARQKADELSQSERHVHTVLHHAMDAIFTFDENAILESFNPAAEHIFGCATDECLGQPLEMLIPEPWYSEYVNEMRRFLRNKDDATFGDTREIEGMRKDGTRFPMEIDISEVHIENRYLFIAIARDISQRRKAENELQTAQQAAIESSRSKFEFIANVSQEIRGPMNEMLSSLDILSTNDLPPDQRARVGSIQASGHALITVINDMLDFSRIEAGKLALESIDFDLHRTIDTVYRMFRDTAEKKDISLVYVIPAVLPTALRGDPTRLRQVLINLFDNALKFTDKGEVVLRAEVTDETDDHVVMRFEVEDSGIGIAAGTQQRLFEIFAHSDISLSSPYFRSSGLGLMISKRLAEMMQGAIGVSSEVGRGSNFWFTARFDKQSSAPVLPAETPGDLSHLKILIVNPDNDACESMRSMINEFGARSRCIEDGTQALSELCTAAGRRQAYDLVIFDRIIAGMSGLQFAHALRGDNRIANTRMIMLAATGYRGDGEEVRQAGIRGYLTPPIEREQLYGCIIAVSQMPEGQEGFVTRHTLDGVKQQRQHHALVISADPQRRRQLLGRVEHQGFRAGYAATAEEALAAMAQGRYSLVMVDNEQQELLGVDQIRNIHDATVVVIVSADDGDEQCREYQAAGVEKCCAGIEGLDKPGSLIPGEV